MAEKGTKMQMPESKVENKESSNDAHQYWREEDESMRQNVLISSFLALRFPRQIEIAGLQ